MASDVSRDLGTRWGVWISLANAVPLMAVLTFFFDNIDVKNINEALVVNFDVLSIFSKTVYGLMKLSCFSFFVGLLFAAMCLLNELNCSRRLDENVDADLSEFRRVSRIRLIGLEIVSVLAFLIGSFLLVVSITAL